jgi:hypothetical protein
MVGWSILMQLTNASDVHMGRERTLVMAFQGGFEGESIKLTDQCLGVRKLVTVLAVCTFRHVTARICCRRGFCQYRIRNVTCVWNFETLFFKRVHKTAKRDCLASSCLSVRLPTWNNSAPTGRIFIKFDVWGFLENFSGIPSFIKIW